ncbi:MAG TPA: hypothetical protein DCG34_01160 [Clostridiales bacterium]|jgi:hypothetical protein|nr:hypothetical protein [Clostridiales bacterium]
MLSEISVYWKQIRPSLEGRKELKPMTKGHFIVTKSEAYPKRTQLKLFTKWGIKPMIYTKSLPESAIGS